MENREDRETTYEHVIKYTGLFGGIQGLSLFINVARTKLSAYFLGPAGTGLIALLMNLVALIHQSTSFGISFSAIKYVAEKFERGEENEIRRFAATVRVWCLVTGLLGMLVACVVAQLVEWTDKVNIYLVAPIIAVMAVTAGEQAILKGTKQLKRIALISIGCTVTMLLVCTPLFWALRVKGVALALLLSFLVQLVITLHYSTKAYAYRLDLAGNRALKSGVPMMVLGVGYVVAGVFGQGAEYVIRHCILDQFPDMNEGNVMVGLYTAGYSIMVTYASYVFTAIEVDYFPRLTAVAGDRVKMNATVNQQIEVCALMMAPLLVGIVLFAPHIVHLFYTHGYDKAIPMTVTSAVYMYCRAFSMPIEYLALAKGDSKMFMTVELVYNVLLAVMMTTAFRWFGLLGCGVALSMIGVVNMCVVMWVYRWRYGFVFSWRLGRVYVVQLGLVVAAVLAVMHGVLTFSPWVKWTVGPLCLAVSAWISLGRLRGALEALRGRVKLYLQRWR